MKKSEIALIAAQTIDEWYDQKENGMCVAIMDVSCAPIEHRFSLMGELKEMFIPD